MFKLLLFLKRIHYVLLFLVLEAAAVFMFVRSNPYHNARMVNASNAILGGIGRQLSSVDDYFGLRRENLKLTEEIARLRAELSRLPETKAAVPTLELDSAFRAATTSYKTAKIVRNSVTKRDNYLTINRGSADGIRPDMALMTNDGIVGYVVDCSPHHSVAISILNASDFRTSGKIKGSDFTGSILWDGLDYRHVEFTEVPKYAGIEKGDTIVTTEYSNIFPAELPIGTVEDFELVNATFFKVRLRLFADMSRLKYVYVVSLDDQQERGELERRTIKNK